MNPQEPNADIRIRSILSLEKTLFGCNQHDSFRRLTRNFTGGALMPPWEGRTTLVQDFFLMCRAVPIGAVREKRYSVPSADKGTGASRNTTSKHDQIHLGLEPSDMTKVQ